MVTAGAWMDDQDKLFHVLLLGPMRFTYRNEPVSIQRRQPRILLIYLACQGEMVGRLALTNLLWPEEPEEDARRHLRETLARLRADLPDPELVITEHDRLGLDFKRVYVDVLDFERTYARVLPVLARMSEHDPLPETVYLQMARVARLWRGEEFAGGANIPENNELQTWRLLIAQDLEVHHHELLRRLAAHAAARGDLDVAIQWAREALRTDPCNSDLHMHILTWLMQLGRRSDALSHCDFMYALYAKESDEVPPTLQDFCRQIRQQLGDEPAARSRLALSGPRTHLVGRQALLKDLTLAARRGGMLVLSGEAGIGKTRLAHELHKTLQPEMRLLYVAGYEDNAQTAYLPLITLLRQNVQTHEWQKLGNAWLAAFTALLPELTLQPPLHLPSPEVVVPVTLYEALRCLLLRMADPQPLYLLIDNVHWCDQATLSALTYLLEHGLFAQGRAVLVLTYCPAESNPAIEALLRSTAFPVYTVQVDTLDDQAIADLATELTGCQLSDAVLHRLARDSGGNPFFLSEILRTLLDLNVDLVDLHLLRDLPLSNNLISLVHRRLRSLSPAANQLLTQAAILGTSFGLDVLEKAAGMEAEQFVLGLEELECHHLIRPLDDIPPAGGYVFVHHVVRQVVTMELSLGRARWLHLRAAHAIEQRSTPLSNQEWSLAEHYLAAGEFRLAFEHWIQAAVRAQTLTALDEARMAYHQAEILLSRIAMYLPDEAVYRLYTGWGDVAYDATDFETVEHCYATLLRLGQQRHSPWLIGSALSGQATLETLRDRPENGLSLVEQARPYLEQSGDLLERMRLSFRQGILLLAAARYHEATDCHKTVLDLGGETKELPVLNVVTGAENQLALLSLLMGWPQKAHQIAVRYLRHGRLLGPGQSTANAHLTLCTSHLYLGNYSDALEHYHQAFQQAQDLQAWILLGYIQTIGARLFLATGRIDDGWRCATACLEIGKRYGIPPMVSHACCAMGDFYYMLADLPAAKEMYQNGLLDTANFYHHMDCLYRLGVVQAELGEIEEGTSRLEEAIRQADQAELGLVAMPARMARAALWFAQGQPERALELSAQTAAEVEQRGMAALQTEHYRLQILNALHYRTGIAAATQQALKIVAIGRGLSNPWVELNGQQLLLKLHAAGAEPGSDPTTQIETILARLSPLTQEPLMRPAFNDFCHKIRGNLS